jgi:hypothetical protein
MLIATKEHQQLNHYYLEQAFTLLEAAQEATCIKNLPLLMPRLQNLSTDNQEARKLFNEICFAGLCPKYDHFLQPELLAV